MARSFLPRSRLSKTRNVGCPSELVAGRQVLVIIAALRLPIYGKRIALLVLPRWGPVSNTAVGAASFDPASAINQAIVSWEH